MFQSLGNLASLLKNAPEMLRQAQQMQSKMQELQEKLGRLRVEGSAGGGMVTVVADGKLQLVSVRLDDSLLKADDREILEDLIRSATNQALEKAREAASEEMSQLMGDAGSLPGLGDIMAKLKGFHAGDDVPGGSTTGATP